MRLFLILFSLMTIFVIIIPLFISLKEKHKKALSIVVKALGTLLAILYALIGFSLHPDSHAFLLTAGLVCGVLGDIFLELFVPIGGFFFLVGNIIYIVSMIRMQAVCFIQLILFLLLALFLIQSFYKYINHVNYLIFLFVLYGISIAFMTAIAIPLIFSYNPRASILGLGAFLFFVSDYLLARRVLKKPNVRFYKVSLGVYYTAQLIIGSSLFLTA